MTTKPSHIDLRYDARVRRVETTISLLLRWGVLLSAAIIVIGVILTFAQHDHYLSSSAPLSGLRSGETPFPTTLVAIVHGLAHLRGDAIMTLGLLTLLATPILRVAVSILIFWLAGDRVFTTITIVVLCLLLTALFLGKAAG
jgi:uncharacterized membrane protein